MKKSPLPLILALALVITLATTSCSSSQKQAPTTPPDTPPIPSEAANEDTDRIIQNLLLDNSSQWIREVSISEKRFYSDEPKSQWILFDVFTTSYAVPSGHGIVRKVPDGQWELVAGFGTPVFECDLPEEVRAGLALSSCEPDSSATASATSGQDIDKAIRDCVLDMTGFEDVRIDKKTWYVDASGTTWVLYHLWPLPEGLTDPARGVMKRPPEGNWERVSGPGTAFYWCGLPEDVQTALGIAYGPEGC